MEILITICARGGSTGIPNKNIKKLNGKHLIEYTIETAKSWGKASEIILSSDDEQIMQIAKDNNILVPFERPKELSINEVPRTKVVQHALNYLEDNLAKKYDYIMDLSVTSPLRIVEDLEKSFKLIKNNSETNNIYSVCEADKNPYFNMVEFDENGYTKLVKKLPDRVTSRQSALKVYAMNDSINIFRRDYLVNNHNNQSNKTKAYIMPKERSIDIDNPLDFKFAEFLMKENNECE